MDHILCPDRLDAHPFSHDAVDLWTHWPRTFGYFLTSIKPQNVDKLATLTNYATASVTKPIRFCSDYNPVITTLQ